LNALVLDKQREYGSTVVAMELTPGPVQLLLDPDPRVGVNAVVACITGYNFYELRRTFSWLRKRLARLWPRNKVLSLVGAVALDVVQRSIADQQKAA
jgi:REP element-mobilizing transposase RayT